MKYPSLCVSLTMVLCTAGITLPRSSLAVIPDYSQKSTSIAHQQEISTELSPTEPSGSVTLEMAVNAAINRNPSLAATWYEFKARQGAAQQAGLPPNPVLFGEMEEFGGSGTFSDTGVMSSRIGISQQVPLGGKINKRVRHAETTARIAEFEHLAQIVEIRALAEKRFFAVFSLQDRLTLQSEHLSLVEKTNDVVAVRVKAGDTSPLDLYRSQVELASAMIEMKKTDRELEAARNALAESWGARTVNFSSVSAQYHPVPDFTEQEIKQALERSPAWHILAEKIAGADTALDLAKSHRIPDIELEGGVQRFNEADNHAFFVGVSIPLPLFDRNQGGIAVAAAIKSKTHHEREAGILSLHAKVQDAWYKMIAARQALQSLESTMIPAAQNAYDSIGKAYKAGEVDILELLDAQRSWVESRTMRLDLLGDLENSRIEIKRLVGEGIPVPSVSADNKSYNQKGMEHEK